MLVGLLGVARGLWVGVVKRKFAIIGVIVENQLSVFKKSIKKVHKRQAIGSDGYEK